jgi:hypothetical protein
MVDAKYIVKCLTSSSNEPAFALSLLLSGQFSQSKGGEIVVRARLVKVFSHII